MEKENDRTFWISRRDSEHPGDMLFLLENQVSVSVWTDSSSSSSSSSSAELIQAAVPPSVELGLTVLYTVLYSLLFVFVYLQLWLILRYGYKRFSYQSVFLFLCLLWSALRTTLFSFYFKNVVQANQLQPLPFWLLYCFPVCLQFFTLCLLNLYFAQVSPTLLFPIELNLFLFYTTSKCVFMWADYLISILNQCNLLYRDKMNPFAFMLNAISMQLTSKWVPPTKCVYFI